MGNWVWRADLLRLATLPWARASAHGWVPRAGCVGELHDLSLRGLGAGSWMLQLRKTECKDDCCLPAPLWGPGWAEGTRAGQPGDPVQVCLLLPSVGHLICESGLTVCVTVTLAGERLGPVSGPLEGQVKRWGAAAAAGSADGHSILLSVLVLLLTCYSRGVARQYQGGETRASRALGAEGLSLHGNRHALFTWPNE